MEQNGPPSPAPSNDDIYPNGLHHLIRLEGATSYPREHLHPSDMGGMQTPSRYGTPGPQQEMQYDHHSPYSHRPHDGQMSYSHGYDTSVSSIYGPMTGELSHQPYSTPDTSPPTPSRPPDGLTTRSGLNIQKGPTTIKPLAVRASRVEKSTPKKKKERAKSAKKVDVVKSPLSELAKEQPHIPVADIGAYVQRSSEIRMKEVEESKTPGRIKRPMNAFMLYRKAYQNLAKSLCTQNNHQLVSQVCGAGWPLEPEHIRDQFNEWAKEERANHQLAHPGYKFTPSKPRPKAREEEDSDQGDMDDMEWNGSRASSRSRQVRKPGHGRNEAPASIFHNYPPLQTSPMGLGVQTQSMYHYSNPGKPLPAPYSQNGLGGGQYYQQSVHQRQDATGFVEDVLIRKTPSPAMGYAAPSMDHRYDGIDHYGPMSHPDGIDPIIDPGLMGHGGHPYGDMYGNHMLPRWTNPLNFGDGRQELIDGMGYDESLLTDPQIQILRGPESSWRVEELDSSHFTNSWIEPE